MRLEAQIEAIDRLAWLRLAQFSEQEIQELRDRFVVFREDPISKELSEMRLYEEREGYIGLPRQRAIEMFGVSQKTACNAIVGKCEQPQFLGEFRDGQVEAIESFFNGLQEFPYGGLIEAPCGSGKTVVALAILALLGLPTVILVHKQDLMDQWFERIKQFLGPTTDVGWVRQDDQDIKNITIAMMQSVYGRMEELAAKGFFNAFSLVIADEAHIIPAKTFEQVIRQFPAVVRIGLSATLRRSDGLEDVFYWHIGPKLAKIRTKMLVGKYVIVRRDNPQLRFIKNDNVARAITMIARNSERNEWLAAQILNAYRGGRNVLALTDRVSQVDSLCELVKKETNDVTPYVGRMKPEALQVAKSIKIKIGTYGMFSLGTDVADIDTLFLMTPRGDVEQMVGRIQRICEGKKEPLIIDVADRGMGILEGLLKKRIKTYKRLGFEEKDA